ncbi:MAG: hypothetical protein U0894_05855 [Pirellulales bacterium]
MLDYETSEYAVTIITQSPWGSCLYHTSRKFFWEAGGKFTSVALARTAGRRNFLTRLLPMKGEAAANPFPEWKAKSQKA